jgi:hypothetical protein
MRDGCKRSGASEARGSGAGERRCGENPDWVGRHGGAMKPTCGARMAVTEGGGVAAGKA